MIYSLTIELPPTLNDQIAAARSHRMVSAKMKEEWTGKVDRLAKGLPQFPGKVWISFHWRVKNFARDPDNIAGAAKFVMDGLVSASVIQKDSLMIIQSPVLHWYDRSDVDEVTVLISDEPIYPALTRYDLASASHSVDYLSPVG